jgi:hypothetical protein
VRVSEYIGAMPFLWLPVEETMDGDTCRGYVERNSIALLRNFDKPAIAPPFGSLAWAVVVFWRSQL